MMVQARDRVGSRQAKREKEWRKREREKEWRKSYEDGNNKEKLTFYTV